MGIGRCVGRRSVSLAKVVVHRCQRLFATFRAALRAVYACIRFRQLAKSLQQRIFSAFSDIDYGITLILCVIKHVIFDIANLGE